jgi:HAD superfamily hydrolase (TIGR01549 family)
MFCNIIWDFDGTLFDTYPGMTNAFYRALKERSVDIPKEDIFKKLKISLGHAVEYYSRAYGIDGDDLLKRFRYFESDQERELFKPFPFAKEACERVVKSGGRNFIVTHRDKMTIELLKYHQMENYFTEVVTSEYGFKRKPNPEAFLYVIEKYKIDKKTALAVGDRELDLLAAKNSGIKFCLLGDATAPFAAHADYVFNGDSSQFFSIYNDL